MVDENKETPVITFTGEQPYLQYVSNACLIKYDYRISYIVELLCCG